MRPFRFLATAGGYPGFAELTSLARKAEAIGCSTFVLPDHLIGQHAALRVLAAVAAAAEQLRVGTFVLNVGLRHPAVLAQDLATLDVLSGGRLEIGVGAGWNKPEHDAIGISFEPTGTRIKRLTEAIAILKGCFAEGPFFFSGEYYTITGHDGVPKPVQRPHPPAAPRTWRASSRICASGSASAHSSSTTWTRWRRWCRSSPDSEARHWASWAQVDQTNDPSFYASVLDATRAEGLAEARRDPAAAFAPLALRAGLRMLDVGCGTGDYLRVMARTYYTAIATAGRTHTGS